MLMYNRTSANNFTQKHRPDSVNPNKVLLSNGAPMMRHVIMSIV